MGRLNWLEVCKHAHELWPDNSQAAIGLGTAYYKLGRLSEAQNAICSFADADQNAVVALNNCAQILAEKGRLQDAILYAERGAAIPGAFQQICAETLNKVRSQIEAGANW